ncbi:hypothetical protein HDA32_001801 [Spinactinospora alkalitolerans]|uniref:Uncharacterized protein n=1 Tax=Spinactinospora alkalitolerans TaxID=687207 RepID=A0A852TSS2_9ACTN|nr:hypothetical protein [Spinactinospora alkalitolerans]NYE46681.1 hypothetical protein [Spinactinospora alkalitolerans]
MSEFLYYVAARPHGLTDAERSGATELVERYNRTLSERIDAAPDATAAQTRWMCEDFVLHEDGEPGEIAFGAVKIAHAALPWQLVEVQVGHWMDLLGELHRLLPDARWRVELAGAEVPWEEERGAFALPGR